MVEPASAPSFRWLSAPAALAYCACAEQLHEIVGQPPGLPAIAAEIASLLFVASVALWVVADARRCGWSLPYDYASFVFVFWPLFAIIYVISARGRRALVPVGLVIPTRRSGCDRSLDACWSCESIPW